MRTIVHISDLHFGRTDPRVIEKVLHACIEAQPRLLVISGDMTQRARIHEYESARAFLTEIKNAGIEYMVIPGNHDISPLYAPLSRALKPYERYQKYISTDVEPRYRDKEIAVCAIDTVRRQKISNGRIAKKQLDRARAFFAELSSDIIRIVVTHHPLDMPEQYARLRLVRRAKRAVYGLAGSRIDLYLSGHYHQSGVVETTARYAKLENPSIAVQAGTVSLRERGEAQSFNVLTIDHTKIRIDMYLLDRKTTEFRPASTKEFVRELGRWRALKN
ncbi:MAG: metallophosphoesterase [Candidatus Kaiserbacteria bacterium]|nr:metallophosphoesterase [Candidatus Kaiserbacteria bacterium]